MIPIFVISLERSVQRRDKVFAALKSNGIDNAVWIKAVDGKNDDLSQYDLFRGRVRRFWHNRFSCCSTRMFLSNTEYACSLSHLKVYQMMIDKNIDYAIILEDDAIVDPKFAHVFKNIKSIMQNNACDLLYLWCKDRLKSFYKQLLIENLGINIKKIGVDNFNWYFNRRKNVNGAVAYAISKVGAQRLIAKGYPVKAQSDVLLGMIAYNHLQAYKLIPNIFSTGDEQSTVVHGGEMAINEKPWYSKLAKRIKRLYHKDRVDTY